MEEVYFLNPAGEGGTDEFIRRRDREVDLIHRNGWDEVFEIAVTLGRIARDGGASCRLCGSAGCSSLLHAAGLTNVDPERHHLPVERFLTTFDGRPPRFSFSVTPAGIPVLRAYLEQLPQYDRLRCQFGLHAASVVEQVVQRAALRFSGDGKLSFACDPANIPVLLEDLARVCETPVAGDWRRLTGGTRLTSLDHLAVVSALAFIELTDQTVLDRYRNREPSRCSRSSPAAAAILEPTRGVILFQEQVMRLLNLLADIELGEAYRIILRAARGDDRQRIALRNEILLSDRLDGQHLPSPAAEIDELLHSCRYAACQAHHLAEAIVVCQAAWICRHDRDMFDQASRELAVNS